MIRIGRSSQAEQAEYLGSPRPCDEHDADEDEGAAGEDGRTDRLGEEHRPQGDRRDRFDGAKYRGRPRPDPREPGEESEDRDRRREHRDPEDGPPRDRPDGTPSVSVAAPTSRNVPAAAGMTWAVSVGGVTSSSVVRLAVM